MQKDNSKKKREPSKIPVLHTRTMKPNGDKESEPEQNRNEYCGNKKLYGSANIQER